MKRIGMICFGDIDAAKNGYAIRCANLALDLKNEGNNVEVYQFSEREGLTQYQGLAVNSLRVQHEKKKKTFLEKTLGFDPIKELYFVLEGYQKLSKYKHELKALDEIYVEGCLLINAIILCKLLNKPIVLDTHCINKDVALKLRAINKLQGNIRVVVWHVIEKSILRNVSRVIAISHADSVFIQNHYNVEPAKIQVIPHRVEAADQDAHVATALELKASIGGGFSKVVCFLGDLGAIQNAESEKYIRTVLAPATPDIRYVFVGNNPEGHENRGNLFYAGFVDAIDPYLIMADACIAPMAIGSGVKTKVLDYLKYRKKVIATPVAVEGIPIDDNEVAVCNLDEFPLKMKEMAGGQA